MRRSRRRSRLNTRALFTKSSNEILKKMRSQYQKEIADKVKELSILDKKKLKLVDQLSDLKQKRKNLSSKIGQLQSSRTVLEQKLNEKKKRKS